MRVVLFQGDCLARMAEMEEGSVDAVCTDPPYMLSFMGSAWDSPQGEASPTCERCGGKLQGGNRCRCGGLAALQARKIREWSLVWLCQTFRVLRTGGLVKVFGGTRTFHRIAAAMTDMGFTDLRMEAWGYGSGWPKSVDVGKALDRRGGKDAREAFSKHLRERREAKGLSRMEVSEKIVGKRTGSCWNWEHFSLPEPRFWPALQELLGIDPVWEPLILGVEREVLQERTMVQGGGTSLMLRVGEIREVRADITAPATDEARQWAGWGTALKPAWEPILVGRKP